MMDALRTWLTSVVTASLLLSAVRALIPGGTVRRVSGFIGALILTAVILRPFTGQTFRLPDWDMARFEEEIRRREAELKQETEAELARLVAERSAAYVTERTGIPVSVEIRVEDSLPVPYALTLYGPRNEAAARWIAEDLGIPEDRQTWISDSAG